MALAVIYVLFPAPLWDKLAVIMFPIDPQRPLHSLYFGDTYMPIEARKTGMYGGFLLAMLLFWWRGRGRAAIYPPRSIAAILLLLAATMVFDGFNAVFYDIYLPHAYMPNLYARLGTGLLMGLAIAGFIGPAFHQTVWRRPQPLAPLPNGRALLEVLAVLIVFYAIALSGWTPLLYPISFISVGGLVVLVMFLGSIFAAPMLRRENTADRWRDLAPSIFTGLLLIAVFMGLMALGRYLAFGWGPLPELRQQTAAIGSRLLAAIL